MIWKYVNTFDRWEQIGLITIFKWSIKSDTSQYKCGKKGAICVWQKKMALDLKVL